MRSYVRDHLATRALQEEGVVATAVAVEIPVASRQQGPGLLITQAENIIRGGIVTRCGVFDFNAALLQANAAL